MRHIWHDSGGEGSMASYFVTRHPGAIAWAARRGIKARPVAHLDIARVRPGDVVIGTLPVGIAAEVCARGARFLALELDVPPEHRGRELTPDEMERFGARLSERHVERRRAGGFRVRSMLAASTSPTGSTNRDA